MHKLRVLALVAGCAAAAANQLAAQSASPVPGDADAAITQGLAAMKVHQPQAALVDFQKAIAADPQSEAANLLAASAELALYDGKAAIPYGERAEQLAPVDWRVHTTLVTAYAMAGDNAHRDNERNILRNDHAKPSLKDAHDSAGFLLDMFQVKSYRVEGVEYFDPIGKYNTYFRFVIRDSAGHHVWTIQLDSDSLNQASWAQAYPKQAAQGERQFQIESPPGDNNISYGTFTGNANYDYVKGKVIKALEAQKGDFPPLDQQ